jgi:hypothetical protein
VSEDKNWRILCAYRKTNSVTLQESFTTWPPRPGRSTPKLTAVWKPMKSHTITTGRENFFKSRQQQNLVKKLPALTETGSSSPWHLPAEPNNYVSMPILILSPHTSLPNWSFSSDFPANVCTSPPPPRVGYVLHPPHRLWSLLYEALHYCHFRRPVTFSLMPSTFSFKRHFNSLHSYSTQNLT